MATSDFLLVINPQRAPKKKKKGKKAINNFDDNVATTCQIEQPPSATPTEIAHWREPNGERHARIGQAREERPTIMPLADGSKPAFVAQKQAKEQLSSLPLDSLPINSELLSRSGLHLTSVSCNFPASSDTESRF